MKIQTILEAIIATASDEKKYSGMLRHSQGHFDSSFSTVRNNRDDPHTVVKHNFRPMNPVQWDSMPTDGFNFFIEALIRKDAMDNIFFPKVYNIRKISDNHGQYIHKYVTEKLYPLNSLEVDDLKKIYGECLYGYKKAGFNEEEEHYPRKMARAIAGALSDAVENQDFSRIKSDELKEALQILLVIKNEFSKRGAGFDLHSDNIMARRTPFGVQLVINDPFSYNWAGDD